MNTDSLIEVTTVQPAPVEPPPTTTSGQPTAVGGSTIVVIEPPSNNQPTVNPTTNPQL